MNTPFPTVVSFGEILLRLASPKGERLASAHGLTPYYGGAEANVCILLAQLGLATKFVTAIPENPLGTGAIHHLRRYGVGTDEIVIGGERIGLYYHEQSDGARSANVFYDRGNSSFSRLQAKRIPWTDIFERADWFHWSGISPALGPQPTTVCLEAIKAARDMDISISVDLNYRASLWNSTHDPATVMPELLAGTRVMNGDLHALNRMLGVTTNDSASFESRFEEAAKQTTDLLPELEVLAMTFRDTTSTGQQGYRAAIYGNGECYFTKTHILPKITDRIGSGDAFMAGLLTGIIENRSWSHVIDFATACGVIKHTIKGDCAQFDRSDIQAYLSGGASFALNR